MAEQFQPSPDVTSDDKLLAVLSYIFSPLVPIILLLLEDKKNRPFIKFHAVQSLAVGVVLWVVIAVTAPFTFGCTSILGLVMFYWAYKAYQGEYFSIPVVTDFIRGQHWV